jgi:hypothetical protein
MAMENHPFIDDFPSYKPSFKGVSQHFPATAVAMLDDRMVCLPTACQQQLIEESTGNWHNITEASCSGTPPASTSHRHLFF